MKEKFRHPQFSTKGLVAYYKLWAGLTSTASVFDYSQRDFAGIPTGTDIAPTYPGFKFNGTDDFIDVGNISANANTVTLWFNSDTQIDKTSTFETAIHVGSNANDRIVFGASTATLTDEIITILNADGARSGYTSASDIIAANEWHHLCCVWDGAKYLIYLDSIQKQNAINAAPSLLVASGVEIGRQNTSASYFGGSLADIAIFNISKSASEVKSIYELTKWRYLNN
jgi:hypothetical protein